MAPKDTVLSIYVVPENEIRFSELRIDKTKYLRFKPRPDLPSVTYTNNGEGVRIMVDERLDSVDNTEFLPSAQDCQALMERQQAFTPPNQWRGLRPLKSTKTDVERFLGSAKNSMGDRYTYDAGSERVDVIYAAGGCKLPRERWNVPPETVISIEVIPKSTLLVRDLNLDSNKYKRQQEVHPDNVADYMNLEDGIVVHTIMINGCEEIISILYGPAKRDANVRCP